MYPLQPLSVASKTKTLDNHGQIGSIATGTQARCFKTTDYFRFHFWSEHHCWFFRRLSFPKESKMDRISDYLQWEGIFWKTWLPTFHLKLHRYWVSLLMLPLHDSPPQSWSLLPPPCAVAKLCSPLFSQFRGPTKITTLMWADAWILCSPSTMP